MLATGVTEDEAVLLATFMCSTMNMLLLCKGYYFGVNFLLERQKHKIRVAFCVF